MNVTIQNACKAYEGRAILDQFDLEFPQKGTICLLGPSGCGKTTLLNCIAGLEMLDSGAVLGIEDRKIAYMFQEDRLLPWISARENVEVILNHPHIKTAERWLEAVGLKDDMEKRPAEVSGGMRQRVALARALAFGGEIFLLDEPFRALDHKTRLRMQTLLQKHTQEALKILVTHDLEEARSLADQILYLEGPPLRVVHSEIQGAQRKNA